jgi:glycosyltransferase involved in cell wall biosynthesis
VKVIKLREGPTYGYVLYTAADCRLPQRDQHLIPRLNELQIDVHFAYPSDLIQEASDDFDLVIVNNPLLLPYATKVRLPIVFDWIDHYSEIARIEYGREYAAAMANMEMWVPKKATFIITQSSLIKDDLVKRFNYPEERISVIPNGADTSLFKPIDTCACKPGMTTVFFMGSLSRWYEGILDIADCVEGMNGVHLIIAGDGALRSELMNRKKTKLLGVVPYQKLPELINKSCICIHPVDDESPLAVYEYAACQKPIIQPKGRAEEALNKKACYAEHSIDGWRLQISALKDDSRLAKSIAENCYRFVKKERDWSFLVRKYKESLEKAIELSPPK